MSRGNRSTDSERGKFYHYSDTHGIEGIAAAGKIKVSPNNKNDAVFGQGVYVAPYGPDNSKTFIAKNNYDGAWENQALQGKVNHCVEFKVPISNVEKVPVDGREVYVHRGPVDLNNAQSVKFHIRQKDGNFQTYGYK